MEKLLVFHLDDNNLKKLKQITGALKVRVEEVPSSDYLKPLEMIANKTASPLIQPFSGKVPAESLIVFCDFTEKKMVNMSLTMNIRRKSNFFMQSGVGKSRENR